MRATVPFWQDEPYAPRPPLAGVHETDVCIVGGGVGGLSTAWHLAERGVAATVVEAREVASGASGRNGGFFIAGPAQLYNDARRELGPDLARRIYAATLAAQREVRALAEALGVRSLFGDEGLLRLAVDAAEAEHVREQVAALEADGFPGELVEEAELPAALRRPGRVGCLTDHDGSLRPARWLRALATALEARGVRIFERTSVEVPLRGAGEALSTPGGSIRARVVVAAADGALPALVPRYAPMLRARRLHMLATEPVAERLLTLPVYARYGYEYYQQLGSGRITLGGFSDLDGEGSYCDREEVSAEVEHALDRYLADELGVTPVISHRWVGIVGYSADVRPFAGAVPGHDGLYVLGGYNGTGNLNAYVAGRIVADLIASGSSPDADLYDAAR